MSSVQQQFVQPTRLAEELYDIEADPYEVNNLAGDERYESVQKSLSLQLDGRMQATGDMGETPESADVTTYWDEHMAASFRQAMEKRGLSPDISDAEYVAWWEKQLLSETIDTQ